MDMMVKKEEFLSFYRFLSVADDNSLVSLAGFLARQVVGGTLFLFIFRCLDSPNTCYPSGPYGLETLVGHHHVVDRDAIGQSDGLNVQQFFAVFIKRPSVGTEDHHSVAVAAQW